MSTQRGEHERAVLEPTTTVEGKPSHPPVSSAVDIHSMRDAMAYLDATTNLERVNQTKADRPHYRLDRMHELLRVLGRPHESVRHVHIAGTKGKGSTCWMTAAMLEGCGHTVGLYTSPHILDIRERIAINRKPVSEADFVHLVQQTAVAATSLPGDLGPCTFFELNTAMALLHFAEQAVDVGVIEVGLGGLLDCTNVITPEVAAVSLIGLDHTAILGHTLEEIAAQKGGIYKPGVPALTVDQDPKVIETLRQCAQRVGAPFHVVGKDIDSTYRFEFVGPERRPQARIELTTEHSNFEHVPVPLPGEHQAQNCGLALAIIDALTERGFQCPTDRAVAGLATTKIPGRFETMGQSPTILLDGAHNPDSMRVLMKTIGQYLQYDALVVIFGCAADKEIGPMLTALSMAADKVIFTKAADNLRAIEPSVLARKYHEIDGKNAAVTRSLDEAFEVAKRSIGSGDVLCITGSFYLVGEAKKRFAERAKRATKR